MYLHEDGVCVFQVEGKWREKKTYQRFLGLGGRALGQIIRRHQGLGSVEARGQRKGGK